MSDLTTEQLEAENAALQVQIASQAAEIERLTRKFAGSSIW